MLMKPAQPVDVDRAVIHPDALPDTRRLPETKKGLVDQIDDVVHCAKLHFLLSENSRRTCETCCCSSSSELVRSGWYATTETKTRPCALPESTDSRPPN